jgi:dTDP-4-amino-4,6-dideoxygalactose transaminase
VHYPVPIHRSPVYESQRWHCPEAEKASREVLSLPLWARISPADQERVVTEIRCFMSTERSDRLLPQT